MSEVPPAVCYLVYLRRKDEHAAHRGPVVRHERPFESPRSVLLNISSLQHRHLRRLFEESWVLSGVIFKIVLIFNSSSVPWTSKARIITQMISFGAFGSNWYVGWKRVCSQMPSSLTTNLSKANKRGYSGSHVCCSCSWFRRLLKIVKVSYSYPWK